VNWPALAVAIALAFTFGEVLGRAMVGGLNTVYESKRKPVPLVLFLLAVNVALTLYVGLTAYNLLRGLPCELAVNPRVEVRK